METGEASSTPDVGEHRSEKQKPAGVTHQNPLPPAGDEVKIIASKGAAGVTGAGLATLAGGLQSHRPDLVDGVGIIVGIDRFMSEARALTNFTGNAVATLLISKWTREVDLDQVERVLSGQDRFDETTMSAHGHGAPDDVTVEDAVAEKLEAAGAGPR